MLIRVYKTHVQVTFFNLKVIQWCTHHKDDPPPPEDDENKEKRTDDIPVWDQEFLKVDQGTLFELILVGWFLMSFLDAGFNHSDMYVVAESGIPNTGSS